MVVIRLSRGGSKKRPFYNIVAADSRNRRDGRFIERLGFYNPVGNPEVENLRINYDRIDYWVSVGAQVSDAVKRIIKDSKSDKAEASNEDIKAKEATKATKAKKSDEAPKEEPKTEDAPKVEEPKTEEAPKVEEPKTEE